MHPDDVQAADAAAVGAGGGGGGGGDGQQGAGAAGAAVGGGGGGAAADGGGGADGVGVPYNNYLLRHNLRLAELLADMPQLLAPENVQLLADVQVGRRVPAELLEHQQRVCVACEHPGIEAVAST